MTRFLSRAGLRLSLLALALAALPAEAAPYAKHEAPIPAATLALMKQAGTTPAAPLLIRIYKKEAELEVWKRSPREDRYVLVKTFPICRWSGDLGPKRHQGDRQTPEGFYAITPGLMNPHSAHYLSFDTGFPNAYDRAHGATGSALMVHGTCSSAGCYAMTDEGIGEIYALMREAFEGGQRAIQLQAFPFRMTPENLVRHRLDPNIGFWRQLKEGSDRFEATGEEPLVTVRAGRYAFFPYPDPDREAEAASHRRQEDARMAALIREGHPAVRTTYVDGGQHPIFRLLARQGVDLGDISQPEAIAHAGREIPLTTGSAAAPHPGGTPGPVPQSQAYAPAAAAPPDPAAAPARLPATAVPPLRREASLALRDSLAAAEGGGWLARLTAATEAVRPEPEGPPARESFAAASRGVVGRDIVLPPGPVARGGSARDIVLPPGPVAQGGFGREILPPGPVARGGFGRNAAAAQDPASRVYSRAAAAADLPVRGGFYGVSAATAARSPARPVSRSASAAAQAPQRWWETRD